MKNNNFKKHLRDACDSGICVDGGGIKISRKQVLQYNRNYKAQIYH